MFYFNWISLKWSILSELESNFKFKVKIQTENSKWFFVISVFHVWLSFFHDFRTLTIKLILGDFVFLRGFHFVTSLCDSQQLFFYFKKYRLQTYVCFEIAFIKDDSHFSWILKLLYFYTQKTFFLETTFSNFFSMFWLNPPATGIFTFICLWLAL